MRTLRRALTCAALSACGVGMSAARAQQPVTREDAVAAALAHGPRASLARTDSAAARADVLIARAFGNPTVSFTYTKDAPQYHAIMDLPLGYPWLRSVRVGAATAAERSARYRVAFERAAVRFDAEAAYARALAAAAHVRLTRRTADDADTLLRMARARREAGDASELDVQLAAVNAGQQANAATDDSLAAIEALLDLQLVMGQPGDRVLIALADTLAPPAAATVTAGAGPTLRVAAAEAEVRSRESEVALEGRSVFAPPSLQFGVEYGEPGAPQTELLPTLGIALPLPLLNWNGGNRAAAQAAADRARIERDVTQRQSDADVAGALRLVEITRGKVERGRRLVASAEQVAAMSLRAYAEGAVALPAVLEAQRNARDLLARQVDDLAAADAAAAALRLVTAVAGEP